jgi:hypothetical protein
MDKEEALIESNLGSNSNGEFLSPFDIEDDTYPSMEEALDEANSRVTNSSKILNIQIGDKDDINEHRIYSIITLLNPCSYETSPNSIGLFNLPTFEISNPSLFLFIKILKGWL